MRYEEPDTGSARRRLPMEDDHRSITGLQQVTWFSVGLIGGLIVINMMNGVLNALGN